MGLPGDLAVLESLVRDECSDCCEASEKELLNALVRQRKVELRNEAITIGQKFFAETPKQLTKRLKAYRKSWKSGPAVSTAA